ncbi:MAG: 30S ribosomal protein S27ae [Candidatus Lokiarchaeota archaeon]|nr:30S ribosomal protein S27ae [Candidatus Lokiarchaeota archaeon]MBD3337702.1 30S ribosomal protein S27ae [Candidatus Lokiarchaeota archaeon]
MVNSSKYYKIEGDKLIRTHRTCPKCGPGVFLADHYDRSSCGRCGYTIFKRKGKAPRGRRSQSRSSVRTPRKRSKSQ